MLDFDKYKTKREYAPRKKDLALYEAYKADEARLEDQFKADALKEAGLAEHPKSSRKHNV